MSYGLILCVMVICAFLFFIRDRRPSTTFEHALEALKAGGFAVADTDPVVRYANNYMSFFYSRSEADDGMTEVIDFIVFGTKGGYALHFRSGKMVRWYRNGIAPNAFAIPPDRQIIANEILRRVRSVIHQLDQGV